MDHHTIIPGLMKSDNPKSIAFNWAFSSLVVKRKFCTYQLTELAMKADSHLFHIHKAFVQMKQYNKIKLIDAGFKR
jgi:hypothetical protein